jgi:hypothetical protein
MAHVEPADMGKHRVILMENPVGNIHKTIPVASLERGVIINLAYEAVKNS